MANVNKVILLGNLTRDPELRYTANGTAVCNITLAINRYYKSSTGEKQQEVSYVKCVAWGKQAEICGEYVHKGDPLFVEGRLQNRSWETQEGEKRSTMEVVIASLQLMGKSNGNKSSYQEEAEINL